MRKVYLVFTKTYYYDANGVEHQMADGDVMPYVYINAEKAIRRARQISENYCNMFDYQVAIRNCENPARKDEVIFAERLNKPQENIRLEIRVYSLRTWV